MSRSKYEAKGISRRDVLKAGGALITSTALCGLLPKTSAAKEARTPTNYKFKHLFKPGKIGKLTIKNRIIKSAAGPGSMPMGSGTPKGAGTPDYDKNAAGPGSMPMGLPPDGGSPSKGAVGPGSMPMGMGSSTSQQALNYYGNIAKGGVGLLCISMGSSPQLADEVHKYNVPAIMAHGDLQNFGVGPRGRESKALSSSTVYLPCPLDENVVATEMMTTDQVQKVRDQFIAMAVRGKQSGFDGFEINAASSHLLDTFLSRFWNNQRTDQYGPQSLENRARLVTEIIQGVKQECGADFVVDVLFNGIETNVLRLEETSGCLTFEESTGLAKLFEKAGADFLHVRTGAFGSHIGGFFPDSFFIAEDGNTSYGTIMDFEKDFPKFYYKQKGAGGFIDIAATIKKAVSIPVGTVGAMDPRWTPELIDNAIGDGKIDFILMTRALIADPDLPNKLAAGRLDEVIPCTRCLTCFQPAAASGKDFCRVNPATYRAGSSVMPEGADVEPASTKKKVMVVGGGPGGMEAARVAALRGHEVTLYERSSELGGFMPIADMVKNYHEMLGDFTDYLTRQMEKRGVDVKLKQEVTPSLVDKVKPDAVIVATGGIPTIPNIPGINNPKVIGTAELLDKLSSLMKRIGPKAKPGPEAKFLGPVGQKVVIIGGQYLGVNMAEFLVKMGKIVTIVDEEKEDLSDTTTVYPTGLTAWVLKSNFGKGITPQVRIRVRNYLKSMNVRIELGVKYEKITHAGLMIKTGNGETETIPADIIIVALPFTANTKLADSLKGRVPEVYAVGDCQDPGVIAGAVTSANLTARRI